MEQLLESPVDCCVLAQQAQQGVIRFPAILRLPEQRGGAGAHVRGKVVEQRADGPVNLVR